jgi:putative membrane protein
VSADDPQSPGDALATERTLLANERTLLAFVRTGLGLAGAGFSLTELLPRRSFGALGLLLWAFGAVALVTGALRFLQMRRRIFELRRALHLR